MKQSDFFECFQSQLKKLVSYRASRSEEFLLSLKHEMNFFEQVDFERKILEKLIYKSKNQHKKAKFFNQAAHVEKLVKRWLVFNRDIQGSSKPQLIPSFKIILSTCEKAYLSCRKLASQTYFMSLSLTFMSIIARIHYLLFQNIDLEKTKSINPNHLEDDFIDQKSKFMAEIGLEEDEDDLMKIGELDRVEKANDEHLVKIMQLADGSRKVGGLDFWNDVKISNKSSAKKASKNKNPKKYNDNDDDIDNDNDDIDNDNDNYDDIDNDNDDDIDNDNDDDIDRIFRS